VVRKKFGVERHTIVGTRKKKVTGGVARGKRKKRRSTSRRIPTSGTRRIFHTNVQRDSVGKRRKRVELKNVKGASATTTLMPGAMVPPKEKEKGKNCVLSLTCA